MKHFFKKSAVLLLTILCSICLASGISACSPKESAPVNTSGVTERKDVPDDGSTPTEHSALDNIAYMATVLDNQPFYHSYSKNSSKATGYEQITQTWKEYKSASLSGVGESVMISSDLSYSGLVKSSNQTCFVGDNSVYRRTGSKPKNANSVPVDITWETAQPDFYDKDSFMPKYGLFSTDLSVFVINEKTVISATDAQNNGDGTYSQTFLLNADSACWYQCLMKTNGSLRDYPEFSKIEITFTFDAKWQVLKTYCVEKSKIAPGALGGMKMDSDAVTETVYDYSESAFDNSHYNYFDSFFKQYMGKLSNNGSSTVVADPGLLDILGSGFSKVVDANGNGQQFNLSLAIGNSDYSGKVYLKLADMSDILGSLDARIALEKEGSGKQDLYIEFADGAVNVYYSDSFAVTADIEKVASSAGVLVNLIKSFTSSGGEAVALSDENDSLSDLLNSFKLTLSDSSAVIRLFSDDILGTGIGANLQMSFSRSKDNVFAFKDLNLSSLSIDGKTVDFTLTITNDNNGAIISREPSKTSADLAEYIDGITNLLSSETYEVSLGLDGSFDGISFLKGAVVQADAKVRYDKASLIEVYVPLYINYNSLEIELSAYYSVDINSGSFGEAYICLESIGGKKVNVKIYSEISDTVESVKGILSQFVSAESGSDALSEENVTSVSKIVNAVLNIDFGKLVTELTANSSVISLKINADIILNALGIDLGFNIGSVAVSLGLENGIADLGAKLSGLGLSVKIKGSSEKFTIPEKSEYLDLTSYIDGVAKLLESNSYSVSLTLDGTSDIEYIKGVKAQAEVKVSPENNFGVFNVAIENATVEAGGLSVEFSAYYSIDLSSKTYGTVYLALSGIAGKAVDVKVYCDISSAVSSVEQIISRFTAVEKVAPSANAEVSDIIGKIISIDFKSVINELTADNSGIKIDVNADEILSFAGLDTGISFGNANLSAGLVGGNLAVDASIPALGVKLAVCGSNFKVALPDKENYLDVNGFLEKVENLLDSATYVVSLKLDGTSDIRYIAGVKAEAEAHVKLSNLYSEIDVSITDVTVEYGGFELGLSAYYTINLNDKNYGTVYLTVSKIGNTQTDIKAYCDISSAVNSVKDIISRFAPVEGELTVAYANVAEIAGKILQIDFTAIINELTANCDGIVLDVNADEILSYTGFDLGLELGNVKVQTSGNGEPLSIKLALPELGLSIDLAGSEKDIFAPEKDNYLDVNALIEMADSVSAIVSEIADKEDIIFNIGSVLSVDGVNMQVEGFGEVSWKNGKIAVGVDLAMTISETDSDTIRIKAVYDEEGDPFVQFSVNGLGMSVYRSDIDSVKSLIEEIMSAVSLFTGGGQSSASETVANAKASIDIADIDFSSVSALIADIINDISVKMQNGLLISYKDILDINLTADGRLGLNVVAGETFSFNADVTAGDGSVIKSIVASFEEDSFTERTEGDKFLNILYNYVFEVLENLSVKGMLGDSTFVMEVVLNGAESGIDALKDVNVTANFYYTDKNGGTGSKLIETDLSLEIGETVAEFVILYTDRTAYAELKKIGDLTFTDIAFKAGRDDLYSLAENLVYLITSDSLKALIANFTSTESEAVALNGVSETAEKSLAEIINAVLSIDFKNLIVVETADGVRKYTVDIDSVAGLFTDVKIGTATVCVNPETREVNANVTNGEKDWLSLKLYTDANNPHGTFIDSDKYIDLSFVPMLVADLNKTIDLSHKEDGSVQVLYTLTGSINVKIASILNININSIKLTVGLDEENEFYFTLYGYLEGSLVSNGWIGITYSGGYLTFGIDLDSVNAKYKVMTLSYLLDNLLVKNTSPVQWLLGVNSTIWNMVCSAVSLPDSFGSGLRTTEDFYLYDRSEETPDEPAKTVMAIADYLNGMDISSGGYSYSYGSTASGIKDKLGLSDNYYAFDVNSANLIGDTLKMLYLGILRNADGGLKGINAYTEVSVVQLTAKLDGGLSEEHAENYTKKASTRFAINFDNYRSYEDRVFGCYSSEGNSYAPTYVNKPCNLVVWENGVIAVEKTLNAGSSVYVLAEETYEGNFKIIYVDGNGNDLGLSFVIYDNMEIYRTKVEPQRTVLCNGSEVLNTLMLSSGDSLDEYTPADAGNATFAGWYKEPELVNFTSAVPFSTETEIRLYAKFVDKTITLSNGLTYTFTYDKTAVNGGYYSLTAFNAVNDDNVDYTAEGSVIYIAKNIHGYDVKKIGANVFNGKSIKNVVVPETVTDVGAQAFMDNYGLQSVVFLAPVVRLGGSDYTSGDNRVAFYGCSDTNNGTSTSLKLYYTEIVAEDGWDVFRRTTDWKGSETLYKFDAIRNLYSEGEWAYVEYEVTGNTSCTAESLRLSPVLTTSAIDLNEVVKGIKIQLNESTKNEYINKYSVEITTSFSLSGRLVMQVEINELDAIEYKYIVNANAVFGGDVCQVAVAGDVEEFEGAYYAKCGSVVELRVVGNYLFDGYKATPDVELKLDENGNYLFEMPESVCEIEVSYKRKPITEVTLTSSISFTYTGEYTEYDGTNYTVKLSETQDTVLQTPVAEGYTFVGWAYDYDSLGTLIFANGTFNGETSVSDKYYAVWALDREEISSVAGTFAEGTADVNEGSGVTVTVDSAKAHSFYKWYSDADFTVEASSVNASNTVLYARINYNLTVSVSGSYKATLSYAKVETFIGDNSTSGSKFNGTATSYVEETFGITEGSTLYLVDELGTLKDWFIGYTKLKDESITGQIGVKTGTTSTKATEISATVDGSPAQLIGNVQEFTVSGNMSFAFSN